MSKYDRATAILKTDSQREMWVRVRKHYGEDYTESSVMIDLIRKKFYEIEGGNNKHAIMGKLLEKAEAGDIARGKLLADSEKTNETLRHIIEILEK